MQNPIVWLALVLFGFVSGYAQTSDQPHTPAPQSAERAAITDALRGGQKVIFQIHYLKVHNGWAWIDATPLDARTKKAVAEGGTSLLRSENGRWTVVNLENVREDPENPMASQEASATFVRHLRKIYPNCPADIFPKNDSKK